MSAKRCDRNYYQDHSKVSDLNSPSSTVTFTASDQVHVQSFPPGSKWQISSERGSPPLFRRDGKELFYLAVDGKLMAVEVKASASSFEFSAPKPVFEARATDRYAVTADGQRFLLNTPVKNPLQRRSRW